MSLLRTLFYALASVLYKLIPDTYNLFKELSTMKYATNEQISAITSNLYLLVSAVMLFAFGIRLLGAIVNPDSFNDKKKGFKAVFMHSIIGIILIGVLPFIFSFAYKVQNQVLGVDENGKDTENGNLIQKYIFGFNYNDGDLGKSLMYQTFRAFCRIEDSAGNDLMEQDETYSDYDKWIKPYTKIARGETDGFDDLGDVLNSKHNDEYVVDFNLILSPLLAGFMIYQLILLCIDTALRGFKLVFLQLMSPLVICAYIFSGGEILKKWGKEVASTFLLIFFKIIGLDFMIIGLSFMSSLMSSGNLGTGLAFAFVIVGLLMLIKQIPNLINTIFGIKIDEKGGGIGGRLAAMAGVGGLAKKAWDTATKHPIQTAKKPIGAVAGVGSNLANNIRGEVRQSLDNSKKGKNQVLRGIRAASRGALLGVGGGALSSVGAMRRGWKTGGLKAIGTEARRYDSVHPEGSTFKGRTREALRSRLGLTNSAEAEMLKWDKANEELNYNFNDDKVTIKDNQELARIKSDLQQQISTNKVKNMEHNRIKNAQNILATNTKQIIDRADAKIVEKNSDIKISEDRIITDKNGNELVRFDKGTNISAYRDFIDSYRSRVPSENSDKYKIFDKASYQAKLNEYIAGKTNVKPIEADFMKFDQAKYDEDFKNHSYIVSELEKDYKDVFENDIRSQYIKKALDNMGTEGIGDDVIKNLITRINESNLSSIKRDKDGKIIKDAEGNLVTSEVSIDSETFKDSGLNMYKFVKQVMDNANTYSSLSDNEIVKNDAEIRDDQERLNAINAAEEDRKQRRAEFEASNRHQDRIADDAGYKASHDNNGGNNKGNK